MGKKMKLLQWPSCNHPKTLSYRFNSDDVIKTVNSVFFDQNDVVSASVAAAEAETPESWFTNSSESASFSTDSDDFVDGESLETVVAGARSERRLFFDPGSHTSSIVAAGADSGKPSVPGESSGGGDRRSLGKSVALAMESDDPYGDFKRSMAEMVETNGVREWEGLEELLGWYLRMNSKDNHGFIVGAFVDLLVEISSTDSFCDNSTKKMVAEEKEESFASALSRFSSPNSEKVDEEERNLIR